MSATKTMRGIQFRYLDFISSYATPFGFGSASRPARQNSKARSSAGCQPNCCLHSCDRMSKHAREVSPLSIGWSSILQGRNRHARGSGLVVDSDWISTAGMVLVLLLTALITIIDASEFAQGHLPRVTYSTVILAVYTGYLAALASLGRLFRLGCAAVAIGAAVRAICHYAGLSSNIQREAAINGLALSLFASIAIFVAAVQWFWKVVHIQNE